MILKEKILRDGHRELKTQVKKIGVLRPDGMIASLLVHSISTDALRQADAVKDGPDEDIAVVFNEVYIAHRDTGFDHSGCYQCEQFQKLKQYMGIE